MKYKLNRSLPESTLSHDLLQKITPDTRAQVYYDYMQDWLKDKDSTLDGGHYANVFMN